MCSSRLRHPFWIWSDRRAACFCRKLLQTSLGFFAINKSCHPLQSMYKRLQEYHRVETGTSGLRLFTERLASRFCCLTSDPFPWAAVYQSLARLHGAGHLLQAQQAQLKRSVWLLKVLPKPKIYHQDLPTNKSTSSTAQGGGGSFKNRKPIGELGCCESGMAERSHWWTERCLISLTLSLSFSDYLPTYLPIYFYVSIYLSIFLA